MIINGTGLQQLIQSWGYYVTVRHSGNNVVSYGPSFAGYDLRLSPVFRIPRGYAHHVDRSGVSHLRRIAGYGYSTVSPLQPYAEYYELTLPEASDRLVLPSGVTILAHSVERIVVPKNCLGICLGKSSYARIGLLCNTTPLEPAWQGYLVIELTNLAPWDIELRINEGIAQVVFFQLQEPQEYSGRWQHQALPGRK